MKKLTNLFNVMPHMITFRVGMIMKNIHTFFEYVKGSVKMDINTAKNIAGWDDVVDNNVFGGYPLLVMTSQLKKKNSTPSLTSCSAIKKALIVMCSIC